MAVSFQLVERASQSFTSADVKSVKSVFCRDMCVAENTLRGASVELSAYSGQLRRRAQRILLEKVALPLFRRYQKRQPFGCLFFASILAFLLRLMQQFFDRDAVELRERAEIRRAGVGRAVLPFADRLTADAERLGNEFLRHLFFRSEEHTLNSSHRHTSRMPSSA